MCFCLCIAEQLRGSLTTQRCSLLEALLIAAYALFLPLRALFYFQALSIMMTAALSQPQIRPHSAPGAQRGALTDVMALWDSEERAARTIQVPIGEQIVEDSHWVFS